MLKMLKLAGVASLITLAPGALAMAQAANLKVVASFSIIADFARQVGGDRIDLTTLVGPDGDAHVYEPKPADAVAFAAADVVLVNGLHFEGFLTRLVEASGAKAPIVELTKGVVPIEMNAGHEHAEGAAGDADHAQEQEDGSIDPHAFQSIANARIYVANIADAFCAADADGCDSYKANALAYIGKLDATEAVVRQAIASIPQDERVIITSHDAFGYLAHEYGLTFLAPEGISTGAEASAANVAALVKQVRDDKASAIFVENIANPRLIEQIAAETGIKLGGTLYSDALSDASGPASTYLDMMNYNVTTIRGAILGS